jgi:hypothetical protein
VLQGPFRQRLGVGEVVLDQIAAVGFGRRGTRAEMDDRPHVFEQAAPELVGQRVGFDVVVEAQRHQIAPLVALVEPVDGDDALVAALIECPDDGAPDEAGSAGDEHCPAFKHIRDETSRKR